MAEFFNDDQKRAHLAALEREKAGYLARLKRVRRDPLTKEELDERVAECDAEIDRITSGIAAALEHDVEDDDGAAGEADADAKAPARGRKGA